MGLDDAAKPSLTTDEWSERFMKELREALQKYQAWKKGK